MFASILSLSRTTGGIEAPPGSAAGTGAGGTAPGGGSGGTPASGGSGGTGLAGMGGGGGNGACAFDANVCDRCIAAKCPTELSTCFGAGWQTCKPGGPCGAFLSCILPCAEDDCACKDACNNDIAADCQSCLENTLGECFSTTCSTECASDICSMMSMGTGGT